MTPNLDVATKAMQDAAEQARTTIETMVSNGQAQVAEAQQRVAAGLNEFTAIGQANWDAVVKAGDIVAKGAEEASKEVAAFAQSQYEKGLAVSQAMLTVKSMQELVDLQSTYMKGSFDAFYAETVKLSQLSVSLANEAMAPIGARVNAVVEKMAKPIAA